VPSSEIKSLVVVALKNIAAQRIGGYINLKKSSLPTRSRALV
jgi:hypothetical protein